MKTNILYHILPHTRGWAIKKSGMKRNSAFADTRKGAEKIANRFIKKYGGHIAIHNDSGMIVDFI
jgi:hypothetical protein